MSPDALTTVRRPSGPVATSRTIPQPTPQYEQTVRTLSAVPASGGGVVGAVMAALRGRAFPKERGSGGGRSRT